VIFFSITEKPEDAMAKKTRGMLELDDDTRRQLELITRRREESASRVRRARVELMYACRATVAQICRELKTNRPLVERAVDKALAVGALCALDDLPRPGSPRRIGDEAKSWVLDQACRRPAEFGHAAETWTYSELVKHIRKSCAVAGHACLAKIGKGVLNGILSKGNIKPHKVSYYLERRDPEFEAKMANVLCVYKEVGEMNASGRVTADRKATTISYDEKPGIQAIKNIAPQLPPVPGEHPNIGRDHEYKRLGTLSLLAGIDLHTGKVLPLVRQRHRSREFIEFLSLLDREYPEGWKIKLVLDNHSAHLSKETQAWLKGRANRFEFVFTPKHGSWLNMIEMFFSKVARGFLRHIRVETKKELEERIYQGIREINEEPVVFRWKYKMEETRHV
jgi:transposase